MEKFQKQPLNLTEQVELLSSRGLVVLDPVSFKEFLSQINYYRFSAYCLPFEVSRHQFKSNTNVKDIVALYEFDRRLRFLIDEALEIFEIALRTSAAYYLSHKYGPFIHEDALNFYVGFKHSEWIEKVHQEAERSNETFITHYKSKYEGFPSIPIWMVVEIMSLGSLSKLIHNLLRKDQIELAAMFKLHSSVFLSWLHTFTYVRNICAHHGRLWNRELAIAMTVPKDSKWQNVNHKRVSSVLFALNQILFILPYEEDIKKIWRKEIEDLFEVKINLDNFYQALGLNGHIKNHILWKEPS